MSTNLYQQKIIQEELYKRQFRTRTKTKLGFFQICRDKAMAYLLMFLETSSIHGLNHLVAYSRNIFEKLLWLQVVSLSVFGTVYLSRTTWLRYQYSPTVLSIDRDMFAWNTTFPAVTVCPEIKLDAKKMRLYLKNSSEPDKKKLELFIYALSNATFETFAKVPDYDGIPPNKYIELLTNLSINFAPTLTIGATGVYLAIVPTVTEMGMCYAIKSKVAVYNIHLRYTNSYRESNRWDTIKDQNESFFIHPLDGEIFAQAIYIPSAYDVYLHGPLEVPDISTKKQHSEELFYMKLYVTAIMVYTAPEAAKLSVSQRRCRFPHENNLIHNSVYSYTMCRMECRIRLCLKYCQCLPYFYRTVGDDTICDAKGLHCLAQYQGELYSLRDKSGKEIDCDCLPLCNDVNYVIQSIELHEWFLNTTLQWGITTYPRMRYRRDIIFGFTDVLVAVGSMAGLFLGCSVLSFMEIVYFLTLRLFWFIVGEIKKR